ncbi:MAG: DUF2244 domain-containing protein [Aestuariivirga sp.]
MKTWAATLTPHRSLSRQGFLTLMGVIAGMNFAGGLFFFLMGAWPVVGFMGLDVALIWWAFRANFADARRAERIEINTHELILERIAWGREPQIWHFLRRSVRVELKEDRARDLVGGLYLRSGGMRTEIGKFLNPREKKSLAQALASALASPN